MGRGVHRLFDRRVFSADDARRLARGRLPRLVFDYFDGAAGTEAAAARNRAALEATLLQPRALLDVREIDLGAEILGRRYDAPFGVAPMGMCGLACPGADRLLGAAARARNLPIGLSTAASLSLEEMRAAAGEGAWFQLYAQAKPGQTEWLIDRAEAAGYEVLILTVDVPQVARRRRDVANGFQMPFRFGPRQVIDFALHPRWSLPMLAAGAPRPANFEKTGPMSFDRHAARSGADWAFLAWLRERWRGKLVVKGVTSPDDARRIAELGVDAIWVSTHGGRQLESAPAAADALPKVRAAVGPDLPIIFDSGVRGGDDVARALALGADFAMLGRPLLFALGAGGAGALASYLDELGADLRIVMAQIGATSPAAIGSAALVDPPAALREAGLV